MATVNTRTPTLADFPSMAAVITAVPGPAPVTAPLEKTVATPVLLLVKAAVRSVTRVPFPSRSTTVTLVCAFVASTESAIVIVTLVTGGGGGGDTMMVAVPEIPSLVAVTIALPGVCPVITPVADTVAMLTGDDDHVTTRPLSVLFAASFNVAVASAVCPGTIDACPSATVMLATGAGGGGGVEETVSVAPPDLPATDAVMVAVPAPVAVTKPLLDTVATARFEEPHLTVSPCTTKPFPLASFKVAEACAVCPTLSVVALSVTVMLARLGGGSVMLSPHAERMAAARRVFQEGLRIKNLQGSSDGVVVGPG